MFDGIDIENDDIFSEFEDVNVFEKENTFFKPKKHKFINQKFVKFDNAYELVKKIDLQKDERVFSFIKGNFVFSDLLVSFLVHHDIRAVRMDISTLSFDDYNVLALKEMFEKGYIDKLNIIVSDYFYSHERNKKIKFAYENLPIDKFQLAVLRSHTKFTLIETDRNHKFIIHGSSNLRSSDNIEQFMIEENEEMYDFCIEHNNEIIKKYNTIKNGKKQSKNKSVGK